MVSRKTTESPGKKHAVLSALGNDRVGVASDVSCALSNRNLEIEDSRWTVLGGKFALLAHVCGEEDDVALLSRDLDALGTDLGFDLRLEALQIKRTRPTPRGARLVLDCFSSGPAGLSTVTEFLKRHDVSIEKMSSDVSDAPCTSEMMFHMQAVVSLPRTCSIGELKAKLSEVQQGSDLDIMMQPTSSATTGREFARRTKRQREPASAIGHD